MSAPRGFPSQEMLFDTKGEHTTIEPIRAKQQGLSVNAHVYVYEVGTDAVEAGSTETVINATAHAARKGDIIRITSGALDNTEVKVFATTTNSIQLCEKLNSAPLAAVTFQILRAKYPVVTEEGFISVTVTPSPIAFVLDTVDTEVNEDTVTPSNSRPLPVKLMDQTGVEFGTASVPVRIDPTGSTTQPISAAALPLPAGAATAAHQVTGNAELLAINGKIVTVDTGNVTVVSSALPTGASTSALQTSGNASLTSIDGKLNSLGQKAMAASAPVVIASDQSTLPVSVASLPLPSGAATEATLASIDGKIVTVDTGAVTISTALPAGSNNIGDVDVLSLPSIPAGTNNIGDVDVLSLPSIPAGSNLIGSVDVNLDVVDFIDTTPVLDTSVTNITASAGNPVEIVASLASNVKKIRVNDTTGEFIGVYTGAALSEVLQAVIGPGLDGSIEVKMSSAERVSLRNMANAAISVGKVCIQFLG